MADDPRRPTAGAFLSRPEGEDAQDREAREELMRLAVVAAHQLKSPLNSVQTVLSLLIGGFGGPITAGQRELLEKATASCARGTNVVGDLLRLRGLEILAPEDLVPVNLAEVFRATVERVREEAATAQVELVDEVGVADADDAWVLADPATLREVLQVVKENAVKYTPAGGRVDARLFPTAGTGPRWLKVEVTDTGIGIPPEAWDRLFTEFYRAPNARLMRRDGTGLGLAFAWRAVKIHGGALDLRPAECGGTQVVVGLPRVSGEALAARRPEAGQAPERAVSQRVVVVGGVTAGSKTAAKIMRLDPQAEVTIVERGKLLSYAGCGLPYYISGAIREQRALVSSPLGEFRDLSFFHSLKNVRVMDMSEALSIDREARTVRVRRLVEGTEAVLPYDRLVLATGASARIPPLENVRLDGIRTLHGVEDAEAIRAELQRSSAKEVVIVGAGLLGCQVAESVVLRGARLSLVEERPHILGIVDPDLGALVRRYLLGRGVKVHTGCPVSGFEGDGRVSAVVLADGRRLPCDFVILAAGVVPNVALARAAGLKIGSTGAIRVDASLRTSDPRIWAVGDCAESFHRVTRRPAWFPMGSTALKQGRTAAINICGGDDTFPGVVGAVGIKLFDLTVASVGPSEQEAREAGFDPVTATISSTDREHYLPNASPIMLRMVADRRTGRILGAQGIGLGEVAKRVDIVAAAVTAEMDLVAFSKLDLVYAPPFSQALDTVLTAAHVLRNKIDGVYHGMSSSELHDLMDTPVRPILLDVRLPSEYGLYRLAGSLHIPFGSLRGRLHQVPRDRDVVVIGKTGLRAYEASLVLRAAGYERVRVLDGGLDGWPWELERL